jgi:hypothetical protein
MAHSMKPTMREIARAAAEHFNISVTELRLGDRKQKYAWPRQVAMTICRYMTTRTYPEIGGYFGGRDHTTAIHAFRNVDKSAQEDAETFRDVMAIAAHATGMSIDRQVLVRDWAHELRPKKGIAIKPYKFGPPDRVRWIVLPPRAEVRGHPRPVTMPSEFAPPTKARLMGQRA